MNEPAASAEASGEASAELIAEATTRAAAPASREIPAIPETPATPTSPELPATRGGRLRAERERRGLSLQKAADDLHLDGWVIEALENEDYERIGPAVFARGHLKKYAGNLGLPVDEFLDGFDGRQMGAAAPSHPGAAAASLDAAGPPAARQAAVVGLVLAVAVAAGVWSWKAWWPRVDPSRLATPAATTIDLPSPAAPANEAAQVDENVKAAAPAATPQPPAPSTEAQAAKVAEEPSIPAAPEVPPHAAAAPPAQTPIGPGAGHARLRISFSADTHVEVRDAAGKLIFAGTGQANSVKQLSGAAPMHVVLSDAGGVQLEINDRAVAIGAKFLSGSMAHFDAGADGVLRHDTAAVAEQRPRG